ncbi:MAG: processing protein [Solirubrobacteraceae bacterium]|nr:processing protein [Solirubrobacteraceae bacterium]
MTAKPACPPGASGGACDQCLRRSWLVAALAGHLEIAWRQWRGPSALLGLDDDALLEAVRAHDRRDILGGYRRFDARAARARCVGAGLLTVCRHDAGYPSPLRDAPDPPAVLHVAGRAERLRELLAAPAVAVVGARAATDYGGEVASALARGLAAAGVTVVSGMAMGIDSAAHSGALDGGGATIAVLGSGADVVYPSRKRALHRRIVEEGAVVSEFPPRFTPRRWSFPARNRIIAALASLTVVVEAAERSGSLITAEFARDLGRDVGAVPGQVTCTLADGTNALLRDGAHLIRGAQDALDVACGVGVRTARGRRDVSGLAPELRALLAGIDEGRDTLAALVGPHGAEDAMIGLADLELRGLVRRAASGRYQRVL